MKKLISLLLAATTLYANQENIASNIDVVEEEITASDTERTPEEMQAYCVVMLKSPQDKKQLEQAMAQGIEQWQAMNLQKINAQKITNLYTHFEQLKTCGELLDITQATVSGSTKEIQERTFLFKLHKPIAIDWNQKPYIEVVNVGPLQEIEQLLIKKLVEIIRSAYAHSAMEVAAKKAGFNSGAFGGMPRPAKKFPMAGPSRMNARGATGSSYGRDHFNRDSFSRRGRDKFDYSSTSPQNRPRMPKALP